MYKLTHGVTVQRLKDAAFIAPGNSRDWREYQAWLSKGGTPEAAEPRVEPPQSDERKALELLLKLSNPVDEKDIALKEELLNTIGKV